MSQPPLGALRVFEAVARLGSFSRAADELCVTQSAVSHQIRGLEAVRFFVDVMWPHAPLALPSEIVFLSLPLGVM